MVKNLITSHSVAEPSHLFQAKPIQMYFWKSDTSTPQLSDSAYPIPIRVSRCQKTTVPHRPVHTDAMIKMS